MIGRLRSLYRIFRIFRVLRNPVEPDRRRALQARWAELPGDLRTPRQILGRTELGCGATVGAMPRCDFACRACYLGREADAAPPLPLAAVKDQMRVMRRYLGRGGNLQLTDGELTLRPVGELIELVESARQMELVPMLMTHGDTFRHRPALLRRLVAEGGLRELSIHIDMTQRGRHGKQFRHAKSEEELMPLRDEFARLIRAVRRETGRPLHAASTVTVTHENLAEVPALVRWFARNSDAFRLLSFQPIARVGRTDDGLAERVDVDNLWSGIGEALSGGNETRCAAEDCWWMGHPGCNRILTGFVVGRGGTKFAFHPLSPATSADDGRVLAQLIDHFGGVRFRADRAPEAIARVLGMFASEPRLVGWTLPQYILRSLRRVAPGDVCRFLWQLATGTAQARRFTVVSHHFMNPAEIHSTLGRQRLEQCVFRVPHNGRLMSMCEFNAGGHRDQLYQLMHAP